MLAKLRLLFEALPALSAREWFDPRVNSQVILQVAPLVELTTANPADQQRI